MRVNSTNAVSAALSALVGDLPPKVVGYFGKREAVIRDLVKTEYCGPSKSGGSSIIYLVDA